MFNRVFAVSFVTVCVGSLIWLTQSDKVAKPPLATSDLAQSTPASIQQSQDPLVGKTGEATVPESARHAAGEMETDRLAKLAGLDHAIRDQEAKVEERRKALAAIVRTKGIVYKGSDADYSAKATSDDDPVKAAADAKDYAEAKRDFETEQMLLQEMKLKQITARMETKNGRK